MTERVEVVASARLHMGFFDLNGGLGRRFGSLGLSVDRPRTVVTIARAERDRVEGCEAERATRVLAAMTAALGLPGGHEVIVQAAIPAHSGLGSGTQLALAVAAGLRRLHGLPGDARGDAVLLARGARSGIGIGLFERGGLVVDGGRGDATPVPPLLARLPVPEAWRILLLLDPAGHGLSGAVERAAFADLPPMPDAACGEICRSVLLGVLPGLAEADLPAFGAAVTRIQRLMGDHFSRAQGGRFTSPRVGAALAALERVGAHGVGQSSWGPTGFAFAANEDEAARLARAVAAEGLDMMTCRALNRGASIAAV